MIKRFKAINGTEITLQINGLTVTLFMVNGEVVDVVNVDLLAFLGVCWFAIRTSWFGLKPMVELYRHRKKLSKKELPTNG